MTDEQRVVLFLALRMSNPEVDLPQAFTYHREIEGGCFDTWSGVGIHRSRATWVRACRRAKKEGMLGRVTSARVPGNNYSRHTFDASLDDLLMNVGPAYQMIQHGNRSPAERRKSTK